MAITTLQSEVTKTATFNGSAVDISALTKPFMVQMTVDNLLTGATALFQLQTSVDNFASDVRVEDVFKFFGPFSTVAPSGRARHHYDLPGFRAGTVSAVARIALAYLDAGALTLANPGTVTATPSASGGTLSNATTYYYKVTALGNGGQTMPSPEASALTTSGTASIALTWPQVAGATLYRIYRGTATNTETVYFTSGTNSYTDTNASSTGGTPPVVNSTGSPTVSYSAVIQN